MVAYQYFKKINQRLVNPCLLLITMFMLSSNIFCVYSQFSTSKETTKHRFLETKERRHGRPEHKYQSPNINKWLQMRNIATGHKHRITVDPQDRLVFWIEQGPPHRLWRSLLENGFEKIIVVPEIVILPMWLVADYSKKRLYYASSNVPLVQSVDYNGRNLQTQILTELHNLFNIQNDTLNPTENAEKEPKIVISETRQRTANEISEIQCPATFDHGIIEETCSLHPGSYCTFSCDVGFEPVSYLTMWCISTGRWSHNVSALCREVTCPDPRPAISTTIDSCVAPHHPGHQCEFRCPIGLSGIGGSEVITCNDQGDWSDDPLSCGGDDYSYSYSSLFSESQPLEFTARPTDSFLNYGDIKLINCATNDETATIQWLKDGVQLSSESVEGVFILSSGLFISDVDAHHAGIYTCQAHSSITGETIYAQGFYRFPDDEVFETTPANAFITVGDDHVIQCVTRDPTLVISWEKDGTVLQYSEAIHKVPQSDNLLIRGAIVTDSGRYTCVAMTFDGNRVAETSADLNVFPQQDIKEVCGTITAPAAVIANRIIDENTQEGRIVNGSLSIRGTAPWIARLWNRNARKHFCAASLVNRKWAVTAAHCIIDSGITKDEMIVRVGDFDTYAPESDEQLLTVAAIIVHENFNEIDFDGDIALIKLAEPVEVFDDFVRPICIPNITTGGTLLEPGVKGQVVGWGRVTEEGYFSRYMKEIMLEIRNDDRCKMSSEFPVTNNMFCAGSPKRQGDACEGDSGGSFAIDGGGRWFLGGIVSWGEGCAREGKFGFYTKVPNFYEWIHNTIANNT